MARTRKDPNEPTIVKKYPNRRLYDTGRSAYVTLDDLSEMIRDEIDFVVVDAKTGEDLTHSVLAQIIAEQESGADSLLPRTFLRKIIGMYGGNMNEVMPDYLEQAMEFFAANQDAIQSQVNQTFEAQKQSLKTLENMMPSGTPTLQEVGRQNMEFFQNAMKMFTPGFVANTPQAKQARAAELKRNIRAMQDELKSLEG